MGYDEVISITRQMAENLPDAMRDAANELPQAIRKDKIIQNTLLPRLKRYTEQVLKVMDNTTSIELETSNFFASL